MEAGLLEVPMVAVYRLHPLTYSVARRLTDLETFCIVNVVAGRRIVPELMQSECTPERIAVEISRFLTDQVLYERTRRDLRAMGQQLGGGGAFAKAAEIIASLLR
jgi:lipid-A-disaccharide synthase